MSKEDNVAAQEHLAGRINEGDVDAEDAVDHDPAPDQGPGRGGCP